MIAEIFLLIKLKYFIYHNVNIYMPCKCFYISFLQYFDDCYGHISDNYQNPNNHFYLNLTVICQDNSDNFKNYIILY